MKIKEKTITRTFTINEVDYIGMDISTASAVKGHLTIPGKLDRAQLLSISKNAVESDTVKVVAITDVTTRDELRGILESVFFNNSELIDTK